jgi:hypothetical protein
MWARLARFYNRAKNANAAISLFERAWRLVVLLFGSAVLAWATKTWSWYWDTFSWAGVAFAFLVFWIGLSLGFFLSGLGVQLWRHRTFPTTPREEAPMVEDEVLSRVAVTENDIAQNKANLEQLQTVTAANVDRVDDKIAELNAQIRSDREQAAHCCLKLSRSLRARDAKPIFKDADQKIMSTAKNLLEGSYPDEAAWANEYAVWKTAVGRVDGLMSRWATLHHEPFLDINVEAGAPSPPAQSNIKSGTNLMRYRTVWLAQQSYVNRRDGIFSYFDTIAVDLPE